MVAWGLKEHESSHFVLLLEVAPEQMDAQARVLDLGDSGEGKDGAPTMMSLLEAILGLFSLEVSTQVQRFLLEV